MFRNLATLAVVCALLSVCAAAQTDTTTSLADSTPQENVAGVSQRSPGNWVKVALARHAGLQALRLNGPRNGQPNTTEAEARFGSSSGSSAGTTTGGLSGLLSLVSQLGASGSLGNLTGLLGSLTSGDTNSDSTTATGTNYTLADLIAMGQAAGATQKSNNASKTAQNSAVTNSKQAAVQQTSTTTTTQPSFRDRWLTAMTSTFFTAITVGFQTPAFVNVLKDAIRPLFLPPSQESSGSNSNDNSSGGGIEDLPSDNGNDNSGSTL